MSQPARPYLRVRVVNGVAVVYFLDNDLQPEAIVRGAAAQLSGLLTTEGYDKILLNFDGVRFLSSEMIAEVLRLHKKLAQSKGRLKLCGLASGVREIFRVSKLDKLLEIYDDEKKALARF